MKLMGPRYLSSHKKQKITMLPFEPQPCEWCGRILTKIESSCPGCAAVIKEYHPRYMITTEE